MRALHDCSKNVKIKVGLHHVLTFNIMPVMAILLSILKGFMQHSLTILLLSTLR